MNETTNNIMTKHLISDFIKFYPMDILEDFGLDYNHIKQYTTLENVFHGVKLVINLPLTLLLIQFLADSVENFLHNSIPYSCKVPFGNGPWCCENELCPKYKQNVIAQCERTYRSGLVRAKFSCSFCHTSYVLNWKVSESGNNSLHNNRKRLEYLDIKKNEILSLWESGKNVEEIARQAYCTPYIVKKVLKQNYKGCNLNQVNSFNEIAASFEEKLHITREKHRSILLDILLNNKDIGVCQYSCRI